MAAADQDLGTLKVQASGLQTPHARNRTFWVGLVVMVLSLISGLATYLILTNLTPIAPTDDVVLAVLLVNVVMILAMVTVIGWQMWGLWRAWRDKVAGSRLHVRIVALFSVIASLPAILLAVAATTSFARGLDTFFSSEPRRIIQNSVQVANAYLREHGQTIRNDLVNMARDLESSPAAVRMDAKRLQAFLIGQAGLRDLAVANVIDGNGQVAIKGVEADAMRFEPPPLEAIAQAIDGQVPILVSGETNRVSAVVKLASHPGFLLYAARGVNPQVISFMRATQARLDQYERIRRARGPLTWLHGLMYSTTALTALLAAIWTGFWFAGRFVDPIGRIIGAAQEVSRGNLAVALPVIRGEGDLRRLSQTFNNMTTELRTQRDALVSANELLLERRQFMEAVLAGVSAGVLGLDDSGRVTLANTSALRLLGVDNEALVGKPLAVVVPEFGEFVGGRGAELKPRAQAEVKRLVNGEERTFSVRLTRQGAATDEDAVLTFDDITELVSAQRTSAWGEVARRLAHEIKNPLTPIILSADRIRRKYGKVIVEDRETFDKLTATIERQAGDIKTMVDEFASFARIPKPVMELHDLREAIQDGVILVRESYPSIAYEMVLPAAPVEASFDRRMITQSLNNLVKNATEAVESVDVSTKEPGWRPRVVATLRVLEDRYEIDVVDNGPGLPKQHRTRLLEPYVTTKGNKGTGLGLSIVQKIVEQHGGALLLDDASGGGALVRLTLPRRNPALADQRKVAAA
jgi:two-component system nitrogen regulation sensor histidine kinase NtrY